MHFAKNSGKFFSKKFSRKYMKFNENAMYPKVILSDKKHFQEELGKLGNHDALRRGKLFLRLDNHEKALESFSSDQSFESKAFLSALLHQMGLIDVSTSVLKSLLISNDESIALHVIRAFLSFETDEMNEMALKIAKQFPNLEKLVVNGLSKEINIENFEALSQLKPEDWRVWCKLGVLYFTQQGNADTAIEALDKAISLTRFYLPLYHKAAVLTETDRSEEAIALYQKIIDLNDRSTSMSLLHLAESLNSFSRFQDALSYLHKAIELDSENYGAKVLRGRLLIQLERFNEAYIDLHDAYVGNPDDLTTQYWYGMVLAETKRLQTALDIWNNYLDKKPTHGSAWLQKGLCLYKIYGERYSDLPFEKSSEIIKESISCFHKSVEVDPEYARGYFMLAICHMAIKNYDKAREYNDFGLKLSPKDPSGQTIFRELESLTN